MCSSVECSGLIEQGTAINGGVRDTAKNSIKEAIGGTAQDMINSGVKVSFTKKELDALGITIPKVQVTGGQIQAIRKQMKLSQSVFVKLLNVSSSSIRQWEQGKRRPAYEYFECWDKFCRFLSENRQ